MRRTKKPLTVDEIGIKIGKVINRYKAGKHFKLTIEDNRFEFERDQESIERESQLDGIYVLRTSETRKHLSKEDTVRTYKRLSQVEQAFRCRNRCRAGNDNAHVTFYELTEPTPLQAHIFELLGIQT